ncbi:proline dehydrogenase [Longimycelium tulufanense]|uniref:Proline dehydrogenase n=1 Tax=Longimycelium tulufanense TaxID=907463 RepID=A0A8J3CK29_9PSEU|nr:(2Fe-2S)-binding protein [Longimycelium tulufanense]GGM81497.1 proline dehydrogenase [Longimycelium tulufanense]
MRVIVDGQAVTAERGQTVAAVLMGHGRTSWRITRHGGRPRGLFCGIGVCFDCLVIVNGIPDVRACQRVVVDGDDIRTQYGAELPEAGT